MADDSTCAPEKSQNSEEDDLPIESPEDANSQRVQNPAKDSVESGSDIDGAKHYKIDRELLAGIMTEVDPTWVEEKTNFVSVAGYHVIEFAGLLNCLNASCILARDHPYYAQGEALWEKHAKDFRETEDVVDAGFFLAAARLVLDQSGFALPKCLALWQGLARRPENCYDMLPACERVGQAQ